MLEGRAVIITGAGSGLGRAYALAAGSAGASVLVNDVNADAAAETVSLLGSSARVVVGSVTEHGFGDRLVSECVAAFGRIDGLVNNAGVLSPGYPLDQADELVRRTIDVNVVGPITCGLAALRAMKAQGTGGAIVNVVSGALEGMEDLALYGATKGAMLSTTYGWALEQPSTGVRVNAISPLAHTSMSDLSEMDDSLKGPPPEAIAPLVVYLLSERSAALNGQVIRFDGRRMGIVAEPRLLAIGPAGEWSSEQIADAFAGGFAPHLRDVGLNAAKPAEKVVL